MYNFNSMYYGFHAGGGYIAEIDQAGSELDLSAKYFYTHREAQDFSLFGERVELDSITSSRIRTGGRLTYALTEQIKPYAGGYYEYEFDGVSGVRVRNMEIRGSSIKGSTGIGEIGVVLESVSTPIQFEFGLQGSGGKRKGVGGAMRLSYEF